MQTTVRHMPKSVLDQETHVWFMNPDNPVAASKLDLFRSILSAAEVERYQRFHFPDDARRYLLAHALTRIALSRYADIKPADWTFTLGEHGRPEVSNTDVPALRFNLTHTAGLVGCVVSLDSDCGIDVEKLVERHKISAVAERMFSTREYKELLALHGSAAMEYFFSRWTLREAYVKALGIGISFPTRKLLFSVSPDGTVAIEFLAGIDDHSRDWQFSLMNPTKDHVAAVAIRRNKGSDKRIVVRFVDAGELDSSEKSGSLTDN